MAKRPAADEWDQLVIKMGELTIAAGYIEMAIIAMVCKILGKTERDLKIRTNSGWCQKLKEVSPATWTDAERSGLAQQIDKIRKLYLRRNRLIHTALGIVTDDSIPGVPPGSIVDLRTHGLGVRKRTGNSITVGVVGRRIDLNRITELIDAMHAARVALRPHMELVDQIKHQGNLRDFHRMLSGAKLGQKING